MKTYFKNLSLAYSSGIAGGICNAAVIWICGVTGITAALGVHIAPSLNVPFIYNKIVWGGIWGLLVLIPALNGRYVLKGILLSLFPTLVQLFLVFPVKDGRGMLGLALGTLTPFFVFIFNGVWGVAAVYWYKLVHD